MSKVMVIDTDTAAILKRYQEDQTFREFVDYLKEVKLDKAQVMAVLNLIEAIKLSYIAFGK